MTKQVFIDMDGVITDFVKGVVAAHGKPNLYESSNSWGIFDMAKLRGISEEEFWKPTNSWDFWLDLEKTQEADWLLSSCVELFGIKNVAILTAPSLFDGCMAAKREWLNNYYPHFAKRVIFCPAAVEPLLAGPNKILLDDRDQTLRKWTELGGLGIQVPRLWNSGYTLNTRDELAKNLDLAAR